MPFWFWDVLRSHLTLISNASFAASDIFCAVAVIWMLRTVPWHSAVPSRLLHKRSWHQHFVRFIRRSMSSWVGKRAVWRWAGLDASLWYMISSYSLSRMPLFCLSFSWNMGTVGRFLLICDNRSFFFLSRASTYSRNLSIPFGNFFLEGSTFSRTHATYSLWSSAPCWNTSPCASRSPTLRCQALLLLVRRLADLVEDPGC